METLLFVNSNLNSVRGFLEENKIPFTKWTSETEVEIRVEFKNLSTKQYEEIVDKFSIPIGYDKQAPTYFIFFN